MMRCVGILAMLLFAAAAFAADNPPKPSDTVAVDDLPKASGRLDGKAVHFPRQTVKDGIKAALGLLASCHHSEDPHSKDEWKKAQEGNHVLLVLARPQTVTVLGEKVEVSQLVVTFPLSSGSIWVRSGNKVLRFAKYEFQKEQPLTAWLRQARTAP
jgi:hypothetical protein